MEGAHGGDLGAESGVPTDERHHGLVDVDDVVAAVAQLPARRNDTPGREGGQIGDRAIGGEAGGAAERDQVIGDLAPLRLGTVKRPAKAPGRVERSKHANVMAATEELLGKRLHVPVHAALVGPGIWRNERNSHESARVVDLPGGFRAI